MTRRALTLSAGPVAAALAAGGAAAAGLDAPAVWTAAVTGLCAAWWILEPIPIPATSLVPFAAFPLLGVLTHEEVAAAYGHTLVLLLLGGFLLSGGVEKSGAHRRLALSMVRLVGGGPRRLVLGFMLATGLASMWISNTAATLAMLPVALALVEEGDETGLGPALLLGIAYAASIGGVGTPIGTPPNVILLGAYKEAAGVEPSFLAWMRLGVPTVAVLLPAAWWLVTRGLPDGARVVLPEVGPWRSAEVRVLVLFGLTALAWITRTEPWGGWAGLAHVPGAGESTVAMAAAVAMFLVPDGDGGTLLDWPTARKMPWGLLLLFGGGIAIAKAFEASGLSASLGGAVADLARWPLAGVVLAVCLVVTFLTEVTSNTATANLLMPILAAAEKGAGLAPGVLLVPAALSASCAFMLPVATAPNAIVFGTGHVTTARMARTGLALNLFGAVAITALVLAVGTDVLRR